MKHIYILIFSLFNLWALDAISQTVTGPSQVCTGEFNTYTIAGDISWVNRITWSNTNGTWQGTTLNQTSVSVKFSGDGTVTANLWVNNEPGQTPPWILIQSPSMEVAVKKVGTLIVSSTGCPGSNVTLHQNYYVGTSFNWQKSPAGQNTWTSILTNDGSDVNVTLSQSTDYRVVLNECGGTLTSTVKSVTMAQPPSASTAAGTITGASSICSGSTPAPITNVTYPDWETTLQWQKNSGSGWQDIAGATDYSYSPSVLNVTTQYQRVAKWRCNASYTYTTAPVQVTVYTPSLSGTLSSVPASVCSSGTVSISSPTLSSTNTLWQYRYSDNGGSSYTGWTTFSTSNYSPQSLTIPSASNNRVYQVQIVAQNGACPIQISSPLYIYSYSNYGGTLSPSLVEGYGSTSGALTVSAIPSVFQKWQQSTDGTNWSDAIGVNTNTTYNFNWITSTTYYRPTSTNNGCPVNFPVATVTIALPPEVRVVGNKPAGIALGGELYLESVTPYYQYQWAKGTTDISGATGSSLRVTEPGPYQLSVRSSSTAPWKSVQFTVYPLGGQIDNTTNMIITTRIKKAGVTPTTNLYTTLTTADYAQGIEYRDGLTRPTQAIAIGQSPAGKDIIQPYAYDSTAGISYLPYVSTLRDGWKKTNALSGTSGGYTASDQYLFYQNTTTKIATSTAPYAKALIENSPLGRVIEQGAPGTDWQPGTHTIKPTFLTNDANDVRIWSASGPGGYYAINTLAVNKTQDENGNSVYTYRDISGHTILKRVQLDKTLNLNGTNVSTPFLETYYVYDLRDNLIIQVPPKAVAMINNGGTAWSTTFRDQWCFVYNYDVRNRLIERKTPDATWTYFVYDPLDRLILTQDGNLRSQNKWAFVKYDIKQRPVMSGLYTNTQYTTRATLQTSVADVLYPGSTVYYEERGTTMHGYTNQSFPTTNNPSGSIEVLNVNYYDNYDFDNNGSDDYSYVSQSLPYNLIQGSAFGLPTGSKKVVLETATWLYTYQFYDQQERVIQTRTNNHLSAAIDNISTVIYDFEGKVILTKGYQNGGGANQTTVVNKMVYDIAGRPSKTYQNINQLANDRLISKYNYNELGQVVEKNLHLLNDSQESQPGGYVPDNATLSLYNSSQPTVTATNSIRLLPGFDANGTAGTFSAKIKTINQVQAETNGLFLQSVDYRYNIRGWLQSINNAQLTNDGTLNDDTNDYFGMELLYNQSESGLTDTLMYNGNIAAVKWKGVSASGTSGQRGYKLSYDKSDRLLAASFKKYGTAAWDQEVGALNESQRYDHNGNILGLQRTRISRSVNASFVTSATSQPLDNLTYTYSSNGNQLIKVEDSALTEGFNNGANAATEYGYTIDGSVAYDSNKHIKSITYNVLNKPKVITFSGTPAKTVTYTYDASGNKLKVVTYDGTTTLTTDYVNGLVYENAALSYLGFSEGRVLKSGDNFEYQYFIKDHLGNTRVVFSSATPAPTTFTATFEDNTQTTEQSTFQSYPSGAGRSSLELFDHTDFSGAVYSKSQLLNGGNNSQVGLAKTLKVYPGDVIHAEVYAKYWNATSTTSNIAAFGAALTSAFGLNSNMTGEALKAFNALNNYGGLVAGAGGSGTPSAPKAFITVLLFDQNFNFVDVSYKQITTAGEQVGATTKAAFDFLSRDVTVKEPGYAYIYISNENPTQVDVYFDDLKIVHNKSNVIQYNEYYPFGLQNQNSWTRENVKGNNFLYNQGNELNTLTGVYDTYFRGYDPALGRFLQVDPKGDIASGVTPYQYAYNSPMRFNDPLGDVVREGDWWSYMKAGVPVYIEKDGPGGGCSVCAVEPSSWEEAVAQRAKNGDPYAMYQYAQMYGVSNGEKLNYVNNWLLSKGDYVIVNPGRPVGDGSSLVDGNPYVITLTRNQNGKETPGKCPTCPDPSTVGNWFYIYGGPNNPKSYNGDYNYDLPPKNVSDKTSFIHDHDYDEKGAKAALDLFLNFKVIDADISFVKSQFKITGRYLSQFNIGPNYVIYTPLFDPVTQNPITFGTAFNAFLQGVGLGAASAPKIIIHDVGKNGPFK